MSKKGIYISAAAAVALLGAFVLGWFLWRQDERCIEYPMAVATDIPTAVAVGPSGEVWFTIDFGDAMGVIRDGKLDRIAKSGRNVEPIGLAVDASGAAWFTDPAAIAIGRIGPDGKLSSVPLGTPIARLARLAAAPDGAIWFAEATGYSFTRLKDGTLTRHTVESLRGGPYGVAVAGDGTVWGTLQAGNQLTRIGTAGDMTDYELPTRASSPTDVAVGRDGSVWVVEFRGNKLARFKDGKFTEYPLPEGKAAPSGLAAAPDGSIWFGVLRGAALGRLRDDKMRFFALPRDNARPYSVAVDQQGNVWYADITGYVGMMSAPRR
ncbi:MAG TPA: hypothetical protein VMH32_10445 [Burkholderiales bacterium]|nr:hypothetical protein [Burkholderiales bacterium]